MSFLYFLQDIRNPVLDAIFSTITRLGEEMIFIAVAIIFFWCIDKFEGYYLMAVGFIGTLINQFLKITFRIPRPWVLDKNFEIVESARAEATGYSFPSGHTQSSVGTATGIALWNKNKILKGLMIAIIILVPFSRMYLGVHTPKDVLVSFVIAIALAVILKPIILSAKENPKVMYILMGIMVLISLCFVLYLEFFKFPTDMDAENYSSALENGYKLFGCILGLPITYLLDIKYIHWKTEGNFSFQIFKAVGGLALILTVMNGSKTMLNVIFEGAYIAYAIRYFIVVIVAGVVWPFIFTKCKKFFEGKTK